MCQETQQRTNKGCKDDCKLANMDVNNAGVFKKLDLQIF